MNDRHNLLKTEAQNGMWILLRGHDIVTTMELSHQGCVIDVVQKVTDRVQAMEKVVDV